jgi:hypothetical protein
MIRQHLCPRRTQRLKSAVERISRQLVVQRTQVQNQIQMKAHQSKLMGFDDRHQMSYTFVEELLAKLDSDAFKIAVLRQLPCQNF